jgi:hypothetical protein
MLKTYAMKIYGGLDLKLHAFFTSALSRGERQIHATAALLLSTSHEAKGLLLDLLSSQLQWLYADANTTNRQTNKT